MLSQRQKAEAEFKRVLRLIIVLGLVMVGVALTYLGATGDLDVNMVVATTGGVFISMVLGCGLFAISFFSSKSGHDQDVADATTMKKPDER